MTDDLKHDDGKPRLDLVPPGAMLRIGQIMTDALRRYDEDSWKKVEPKRYMAAMLRHIEAIRMGNNIDGDDGLPHIDHVLTNAAFLSWFHYNE